MAIDRAQFAMQCMREFGDFLVNPHFLIAAAQFRSGIDDAAAGAQVGPYRLTQAQWDASSVDAEYEMNYVPANIANWRMQCTVFALMARRAQDLLVNRLGRNPSAVELYAAWANVDPNSLGASFKAAFDDTAALLGPAAAVLDGVDPPAAVVDPGAKPGAVTPPAQAGQFNLARTGVAQANFKFAAMIADSFAAAGYGKLQQTAAIANAIAESRLDPSAKAGGSEQSWGLFQINQARGALGAGRSKEQLLDPLFNIKLIIKEAERCAAFGAATDLFSAVMNFVVFVERPADKPGQTKFRFKIAQGLLQQ